jgi:hypothetical protein
VMGCGHGKCGLCMSVGVLCLSQQGGCFTPQPFSAVLMWFVVTLHRSGALLTQYHCCGQHQHNPVRTRQQILQPFDSHCCFRTTALHRTGKASLPVWQRFPEPLLSTITTSEPLLTTRPAAGVSQPMSASHVIQPTAVLPANIAPNTFFLTWLQLPGCCPCHGSKSNMAATATKKTIPTCGVIP